MKESINTLKLIIGIIFLLAIAGIAIWIIASLSWPLLLLIIGLAVIYLLRVLISDLL